MRRRVIFWIFLVAILVAPLFVLKQLLQGMYDNWEIKRPNILLITIDTCRYDVIGAYGNSYVYTPALDRLSRKGILFQRCYSPVPTTGPAHTSIMTGLHPNRHKVYANGNVYIQPNKTIAQILKGFKYETVAFISGYSLVNRASGLSRGFDVYDESWSEKQVERSGDETNHAVINWIRKDHSKPWFTWVHYFDPHSLYQPKQPLDQLCVHKENLDEIEYSSNVVEKYDRIVETATKNKDFMVLQKDPTTVSTDRETLHESWCNYQAEIAWVDRYINEIFLELKQKQLIERTAIIITSDHGEGFDHNYFFGHGDRLWESAIRIPLIFRYPLDRYQDKIKANTSKLMDIMPTILSLANYPVPPAGLDGENLDFIVKTQLPRSKRVWFSVAPPLPRKTLSNGLLISAVDPRFKLIREHQTDEEKMYDLYLDPSETVDVKEKHKKDYNRLHIRLRDHYQQALYPELPIQPSESAERDKLEALGYIQSNQSE